MNRIEKLEPKHVASYLPYDLSIEVLNYQCDYTGVQFDKVKGMYHLFDTDKTKLWYCKTLNGACPSFEKLKPILRPLSDLTKEIEVDGEKFVPIIEVAKLTEPDFKWFIEDDHAFCNMVGDDYYEFWYDKLLQTFRFELVISDSDSLIKYPNSQIDCFNKLFEWHFDTHGLIESGLAVDINTLKLEPDSQTKL